VRAGTLVGSKEMHTMKPKSEGVEPRSAARSGKDLELAREIHALAWLVHGQLATQAWVASPSRIPQWNATPIAPPMPGTMPDPWAVPAVWPCCP
jgi:hypothetical protein